MARDKRQQQLVEAVTGGVAATSRFGAGVDSVYGWGKQMPALEEGWEERIPFEQRRRTKMYETYLDRYECRRAFGVAELAQAMGKVRFDAGHSYNFITEGDVDYMSYLRLIIAKVQRLDEVIVSVWRMLEEDWMWLVMLFHQGRIGHLDFYVGDMFPTVCEGTWRLVTSFYQRHPSAGRAVYYRNHTKIFLAASHWEGLYLTFQASCNCNTNPRAEQAVLTVDKRLWQFYCDYFEGVRQGDGGRRPSKTMEREWGTETDTDGKEAQVDADGEETQVDADGEETLVDTDGEETQTDTDGEETEE